ncbi:hypothetical protein [Candidatus Kuenenia sp.]|uniref:hypothetical protein n=1 Tax=Candidatus Kuenenia sp. TaxID=2499824 RepID=UPI003220916E
MMRYVAILKQNMFIPERGALAVQVVLSQILQGDGKFTAHVWQHTAFIAVCCHV